VTLTVHERFMTVSGFKKVTNGHGTVENANGTFMQMSRNGERLLRLALRNALQRSSKDALTLWILE
jgi:hypothetical protein